MMDNWMRIEQVLHMVRDGQMSSEEGFRIIQAIKRRVNEHVAETTVGAETPERHIYSEEWTPQVKDHPCLDSICQNIIGIASAVLIVDRNNLDLDADKSEYGFDSITITEFINRINSYYNLEISPPVFYEHITFRSLCSYLLDQSKRSMTPAQMYKNADNLAADPQRPLCNPSFEAERIRPECIDADDCTGLDPIAIVGIAGVMPQSDNLNQWWDHLIAGNNLITEIPLARWDWKDYFGDPVKQSNVTNVKWGGFMKEADTFDASFFGISPREAELMDPRQRIYLETVWKAIEDAGYKASDLSGSKTGLFVGVGSSDYYDLLNQHNVEVQAHTPTGVFQSILCNRISYLLNFHGPSEPVDTACSASLVAVHRAIEAIRSGDCDQAIAGGINVIASPNLYIALSKAGMLSEDGRCKTFDQQANGYVRSEGSGAVLLKPLRKAQDDGDHIYAVIRATSINHGGYANSLTTPSPNAQASLIVDAWRKSGIDPATVGYIETHGTGTPLGDPIEINGLKKAFDELYREWGRLPAEQPHCALGAVKSNMGHLEPAAGIAGLLKVLLCMKHGKLPANLHGGQLNPYIELQDSPFYILNESKEWDKPGRDIPRRAGVSSFGFGGVNAHVVLEEYSEIAHRRQRQISNDAGTQVIVLSAKNEECLDAYVKNMLAYLDTTNEPLSDIAYTLQSGRESMQERLAVIVTTLKELKDSWSDYLNGNKNNERLHRGRVNKNRSGIGVLVEGEEGKSFLQSIWKQGKVDKLAKLWVSGIDIEWGLLYAGSRPKRVSLPTYPFARERYWIPLAVELPGFSCEKKDPCLKMATVLHPMLHRNTSNFAEQRYSSIFSGEEFFLRDHVVNDSRILPGVAYLEMARAAVEQAAGIDESAAVKLKHIVWKSPIRVEDTPIQVHIRLYLEDNGEICFEVYKEADGKEERFIFSQGRAVISNIEKKITSITRQQVEAQEGLTRFTSAQFYETLHKFGLMYGASHQAIEYVCAGTQQALAKLSLPSHLADSQHHYVLHPSLMDAALQASVALTSGLSAESPDGQRPSLPFALEELEVFAPCTSSMWAHVRYSAGSSPVDRVQKLDIEIYDEDTGSMCVRMNGFTSRVLNGDGSASESERTTGTIMLQPCWQEQRIDHPTAVPEYGLHVVLLCEGQEAWQEQMAQHADTVCIRLHKTVEESAIEERFQCYGLQVLEQIQSLIRSRPDKHVLLQLVIPNHGERQLFAGLAGLLHTARLEHPKLIGQLLEVDPDEAASVLTDQLFESKHYPAEVHIRYFEGKRLTAGWIEREVAEQNLAHPWKDRGIYLITGGTGGLGHIFAEEAARQVKDAVLILTGRSLLTDEKQMKLRALAALGAKVEYRQADVTDRQVVFNLIRDIQDDYGGLNGIVHGAGIIQDRFILQKSAAETEDVLAPKVLGLVHLDKASKNIPLDFFILFSSVTAVLGNPGQADYAMANSFMDRYAKYRSELVTAGRRHGHTLSINWPLWKEGGMRIDAQSEKSLALRTGMLPMNTRTGIRLLYAGIALGNHQIAAAHGDMRKLRTQGFAIRAEVESAANRYTTVAEKSSESEHIITESGDKITNKRLLMGKVLTAILHIVSGILKVKFEDIDVDAEFGEHGFDSIMLTELANKLNEAYKLELTPTIFFEFPAIRSFIEYLVSEYEDALAKKLAAGNSTENQMQISAQRCRFAADSISVDADTPILTDEPMHSEAATMRNADDGELVPCHSVTDSTGRTSCPGDESTDRAAMTQEPIAIIGMSGKFPMAEDIDDLWANLVAGKHCISEIPKDRWDWEAYYGDPVDEVNRTNIKWGGFIDGIDEFDPLFFGISPKEAEFMDPQQRLLMTYAWKAIEDAGYSARSLSGSSMGIFVGTMSSDYSHMLAAAKVGIEGYSSTGKVSSIGPNRMSYLLNVHGPSEPIETACSSSLIAIHRAVNAIHSGDCDTAIVGGVNTLLTPSEYISFNKAGMLSKDGKCKTFSAHADGYVRGEGVGMLMLKKLKAAEMAGDHIYGVIKGTSENHGGRASSLTAPNPKAQAELLKQAYNKAKVDPATISYIEAHGTGTQLGDPIEINGLKSAFKELSEAYGHSGAEGCTYCGIGSIKANIGHLELAAGIAGLIKVLLQFKHQTLVKNLHLDVVNPYIQLENSPFYLVQETTAWKPLRDALGRDMPRRAGVSSFGFGGANAHIVLEEYIPKENQSDSALKPEKPAVIVFSARTKERLMSQAKQFLIALEENKYTTAQLMDIAYTLQVGRDAMEYRLGLLVNSVDELQVKLMRVVEEHSNIGYRDTEEVRDIEEVYQGRVKRLMETIDGTGTGDIGITEEETAAEWIRHRNYSNLLKGWVAGLRVDWHKLYTGCRPRRMSLPTYPFAKERYWVPRAESSPTSSGQIPSAAENILVSAVKHADSVSSPPNVGIPQTNHTVMLTPVWQKYDWTKTAHADPSVSNQILLIGDRETLRHEIREYYPNAHVVVISTKHTVDDVARELEALGTIEHILWIAPDFNSLAVSDERFIVGQEEGAIPIFRLMKSLLRLGYGNARLDWTMATIQATAVHKHETIDPTHASIYGLAQLMRQQFPHWNIRLLDLEADAQPSLAELVMSPVGSAQGVPSVYRNGEWYFQELIPVTNRRTKPTLIKQRGVYVVIGAAGDAAEIWSEYMIRTYEARLIWIGVNDSTMQGGLNHLATRGYRIEFIPADTENAAELSRAVQEIKLRYSHIDGAVIMDKLRSGAALAQEEVGRFRSQLLANIAVNTAIAQLIGREPLDFVLYLRTAGSSVEQLEDSSAAASDTFKRAFAHRLALQWPCAIKVMNWGSEKLPPQEAQQQTVDNLQALEVLLTHSIHQMTIMGPSGSLNKANINLQQTIVMV